MKDYYVPHSVYSAGYHTDPVQPLRQAWTKTGKKLDMGKSCVRFKTLDGAALDVIGEAIKRWPAQAFIERYEAQRGERSRPATKRALSR